MLAAGVMTGRGVVWTLKVTELPLELVKFTGLALALHDDAAGSPEHEIVMPDV
jgi:hypothetical protein